MSQECAQGVIFVQAVLIRPHQLAGMVPRVAIYARKDTIVRTQLRHPYRVRLDILQQVKGTCLQPRACRVRRDFIVKPQVFLLRLVRVMQGMLALVETQWQHRQARYVLRARTVHQAALSPFHVVQVHFSLPQVRLAVTSVQQDNTVTALRWLRRNYACPGIDARLGHLRPFCAPRVRFKHVRVRLRAIPV
jgi:hypothetical protein